MSMFFVDTNVLIDFLADRRPFSISAAKLFNYALSKKAKIYISAVSYNNIYYILRQSLTHKETILLLTELTDITQVVDVSKKVIENSLKSELKDFEDAIQYNCALSVKEVEIIVTRDTKDFKKSTIPVMTTEEAVSLIENTRR